MDLLASECAKEKEKEAEPKPSTAGLILATDQPSPVTTTSPSNIILPTPRTGSMSTGSMSDVKRVPRSPSIGHGSDRPSRSKSAPETDVIREVVIPEGDPFNLGRRPSALLLEDEKSEEEKKSPAGSTKQKTEGPQSLSPFAPKKASPSSKSVERDDSRRVRIRSGASIEIVPSQKSSRFTELPQLLQHAGDVKANLVDRLRQRIGIGNELYRAALAELFGTGFLVFGGTCVNAQYALSRTRHNAWIGVCVGWGLALAFAVQLTHRISGGHLNPAVSFFQLTQGKITPLRFILFAVAQNVGAFLGAMTTFFVYWDAIDAFDNSTRYVTGPKATAGIFGTFPAPYLSMLGGIFDQIVGTAVLCMLIACIVDRRGRVPPFLQPTFIGAVLILIGTTLGMNAGYAVNPARDFGPRLFSFIAGYGWKVFSYRDYKWFWIPCVAPMIGAVVGAWLYEFFIGFHIPDDPETTYLHRIIDDRNPDGTLREVHLVETKPLSEQRHTPEISSPQQAQPLSYRNL